MIAQILKNTIIICWIFSFNLAQAEKPNSLYFVGSTSVAPLIEQSSQMFEEKTGISIRVRAVGSSRGVESIAGKSKILGTADIGMISRALKASEKSEHPYLQAVNLAKGGIVFVVNNKNPIDNITTSQVRDAFLVKDITWDKLYPNESFSFKNGNNIYLASKDTHHGTFSGFVDFFKFSSQVQKDRGRKVYFSDKSTINYETNLVEMLDKDSEVFARIRNIPGTLGYISQANLKDSRKFKAKPLKLDGKEPSNANIKSGEYKLVRVLNVVINQDKPNPNVDKFVEFTKSPEFKKIVNDLGFIAN